MNSWWENHCMAGHKCLLSHSPVLRFAWNKSVAFCIQNSYDEKLIDHFSKNIRNIHRTREPDRNDVLDQWTKCNPSLLLTKLWVCTQLVLLFFGGQGSNVGFEIFGMKSFEGPLRFSCGQNWKISILSAWDKDLCKIFFYRFIFFSNIKYSMDREVIS